MLQCRGQDASHFSIYTRKVRIAHHFIKKLLTCTSGLILGINVTRINGQNSYDKC